MSKLFEIRFGLFKIFIRGTIKNKMASQRINKITIKTNLKPLRQKDADKSISHKTDIINLKASWTLLMTLNCTSKNKKRTEKKL